ncbi:MAG: hypothetical protein ABIH21_02485 [Patescibacteria group bacterium]
MNTQIDRLLKEVGLDYFIGSQASKVFATLASIAVSNKDVARLHGMLPDNMQLQPDDLRRLKNLRSKLWGDSGIPHTRIPDGHAMMVLHHLCFAQTLTRYYKTILDSDRETANKLLCDLSHTSSVSGHVYFDSTKPTIVNSVECDYLSHNDALRLHVVGSDLGIVTVYYYPPVQEFRVNLKFKVSELTWPSVRQMAEWIKKFPTARLYEERDLQDYSCVSVYIEFQSEELVALLKHKDSHRCINGKDWYVPVAQHDQFSLIFSQLLQASGVPEARVIGLVY